MNRQKLEETAAAMVAPGKGLIAMDESSGTVQKRFDAVKVECTEENRRAYRDALITTPGLQEFISGAILYDETLRQKTLKGPLFPERMAKDGILPGIKVDKGAKDLAGHAGEKVTEGLDGLRERLAEYAKLGARFAKWRAVITIGPMMPSPGCIAANAHALARYAALCQEHDIVPVVEPEVLLDGDHAIDRCLEVSEATLRRMFVELADQRVHLEGTILKASMVLSGKSARSRAGVEEVAEKTLLCLRRTVPAALPGIVFLSGGQTPIDATEHLNAMNRMGEALPWKLSFSYSRALQEPVLAVWARDTKNPAAAQKVMHHRARMNGAAAQGRYSAALEREGG